MNDALLGLFGVLIGSATTLATTWLTSSRQISQARQTDRAERAARIRELLGRAYFDAAEGAQWVSPLHVHESVYPKLVEADQARTATAIGRLHEGRSAIELASTMRINGELRKLCFETAISMHSLEDSWIQSQEYSAQVHKSTKESKFSETLAALNDFHWSRLSDCRRVLIGHDGTHFMSNEIDAGLVLPDSLLGRLRSALEVGDEELLEP